MATISTSFCLAKHPAGTSASSWAACVQSYGSRYVRPPLVVGDVEYRGAMTAWEYEDLSRAAQALQLALALRQEVAALEAAGCKIVQPYQARRQGQQAGAAGGKQPRRAAGAAR
ncbi:5-methyltetrahydropteroyltriglutamate--homocysteine methyltransferase [Tetrabaena socialis]|uniref:5-methyltetrahydropteroyltriglutamate--homocysteine methyltransferase n=1 Tax=Tetrabaena socialis TaxID=47790 RepID=A0A2J8A8Z6_9CHLO|nr:5-methyltetrahydropteroyltriglutamate--homocysteine methyltransferase [Tetrabaena socialis]|eukprot:PNH08971.1 5-methyltetrahydropteroyltriglutamate--homocysteine methyltransferase [Tetrabaena socialis]